MDPLLQQLIQSAEAEGGTDWLRSCLAMRPAIKPTSSIEVPASPAPRLSPSSQHDEAPPTPARSSRNSTRNRRARVTYSPSPPPSLAPEIDLPTRSSNRKLSRRKSRSPPRDLQRSRITSHLPVPDIAPGSGVSRREDPEVSPVPAAASNASSNRYGRTSAVAVQGPWHDSELGASESIIHSSPAAASAAARSWMDQTGASSGEMSHPPRRAHSPAGAGLSAKSHVAQDRRLHGNEPCLAHPPPFLGFWLYCPVPLEHLLRFPGPLSPYHDVPPSRSGLTLWSRNHCT
ncbi:uncharacterized protein LOC143784180 isoform X1 [Ranitomeya variabilis]|uniref:uncharacterized protein LOC143784180 isoform X1 n=1 Tax=Ranitomeya variabilis TaxID=490064 RepID=UPI00405744B2